MEPEKCSWKRKKNLQLINSWVPAVSFREPWPNLFVPLDPTHLHRSQRFFRVPSRTSLAPFRPVVGALGSWRTPTKAKCTDFAANSKARARRHPSRNDMVEEGWDRRDITLSNHTHKRLKMQTNSLNGNFSMIDSKRVLNMFLRKKITSSKDCIIRFDPCRGHLKTQEINRSYSPNVACTLCTFLDIWDLHVLF